MYKRLEKNIQYCHMVQSVVNNRRKFQKGPETHYVNDIFHVDTEGNNYKSEFVTTDSNQKVFVKDEKACFILKYYSDKGDEIEPIGSPESWNANNSKDIPSSVNMKVPIAAIGGRPFVFAMTIAKDLKIAEMQCNGSPIDDQFIKELFGLSDTIEQYYLRKESEFQSKIPK